MNIHLDQFDEHVLLHELMHYLPAQAPLKDFIHHNTLHGFQHLHFHAGIHRASRLFGYKVLLSIGEYRALYAAGKISTASLQRVLDTKLPRAAHREWMDHLLHRQYDEGTKQRVGRLRAHWKSDHGIDMDALVHPLLFRVLCSYLDQGIASWEFPISNAGFLASMRALERNSFSSFFRSKRVQQLFMNPELEIGTVLSMLLGADSRHYMEYVFDQQFAHPGWSGMVAAVETQPDTLLDTKQISLKEIILFELLLELDVVERHLGARFRPLLNDVAPLAPALFDPCPEDEMASALGIWQDAFEWTYYDQVIKAIQNPDSEAEKQELSFQALFCIDDRSCSLRRYLEQVAPDCSTYGTPGFFGVAFFYQPDGGKFRNKLCPAPVTPQHLIKELGSHAKRIKEPHLSKHSHSLARGMLFTQTVGFLSAFRLLENLARPRLSPAAASSFQQMDKSAYLTVEHQPGAEREHGLKVGFEVEEMVDRVEAVLRSIGLVEGFAGIVYVVGHGASSANNPHYAAYDCGACSGRPGSVNARVFCHMANHPSVRAGLAQRGIVIPDATQFLGGLHDTTRDEIQFFDEAAILPTNLQAHSGNLDAFKHALELNAKERSRRLELVNTHRPASKVHADIKLRSVSIFEPRPELNHATNALCIVGRRALSRQLFLDRRSFLNSYDYRHDPTGKYLLGILQAVAPVCGGINLEYFFSRVDNQKLGAGSKLPHNVMGLFGVANGTDGDLRPGLPEQMIEVHDPVRLLVVVEHFPDIVLDVIQRNAATYEWFAHEWVHLVVKDPERGTIWRFSGGKMMAYTPTETVVNSIHDLNPLVEASQDNISVHIIR